MPRNRENTTVDLLVSSKSIWTLLLGVSAITLFFDTEVADPFNTPKLLILILLAAWLLGHIGSSLKFKNYRATVYEELPMYLSLFFVITLFIATLYSDVIFVSLVGETQRRNGFLSYLSLVIIFLFSIKFFHPAFILRFFVVTTFTALAVGIYGLLQIQGKDFVDWNNPYNSMISTLGNPNFASAILAIFSTMTILLLFIKSVSKPLKLAAFASTGISLYCIIMSESRQGLVALAISLIFFACVYIYLNNKKWAFPVIGTSILFIIAAVLGMLQKGPLAGLLYKDSVSVRGFYWRAAKDMFLQNPLTGVGVDSYGSYFRQFREVEYTARYGYDIYSTNAHNVFLQFFSTAGLFVGVAYLLIQFIVLAVGIKTLFKLSDDKQKILLTILSAWMAYQAQSFISIDNLGVTIWGWFLGGIVISVSKFFSKNPEYTLKYYSNLIHSKKSPVNLPQVAISTLLFVPTLLLAINIYSAETKLYIVRSYLAYDDSKYQKMIYTLSTDIIANRYSDPNYKFEASGALFEIEYGEEALSTVEKLTDQNPNSLSFLKGMAILSENYKNYTNAIDYRKRMLFLDPWNANNYLDIIRLSKSTGDLIGAKNYLEKLLTFVDNSEIAESARKLIND